MAIRIVFSLKGLDLIAFSGDHGQICRGETGEAFATWDGGRAAALRSRASRGTRQRNLGVAETIYTP